MKKIKLLFLLSLILVALSCKREDYKDANSVLWANLRVTSQLNPWDNFISKQAIYNETTYIGGKKVDSASIIESTQYPDKRHLKTVKNSELFLVNISNEKGTFITQYEKNKPKGITELSKGTFVPNVSLNLIKLRESLQLVDSIWNNIPSYYVVKNKTKYIYRKDSLVLKAKIEPNPYGTATTYYNDYRWTENFLLPFEIILDVPKSGYKKVFNYSNVEVNPKLEASLFEEDKSWLTLKEGNKLPDFNITSLNDKEKKITKEDFKNKIVLIDFWATWCAPCIAEFPSMKKNYNKYKDKGFEIFSISIDENEKKLNTFLRKKPFAWNYSGHLKSGFEDDYAKKIQLVAVPKPILIDENGKILAMDNDLRGELLEKTLDKIFQNE